MSDLPTHSGPAETMGHKIGKLPVWAWVGIVGGAIGVSIIVRRRLSSPSSTAGTPTPALPVSATTASAAPTTGVTAADISPYLDNNSWGVAAITALLQAGADPNLADSAVRDYLAGDTLSMDESALISRAIGSIGPTPEILSPLTTSTSLTDPGTNNPTTPGSPVSQLPPSTASAPAPTAVVPQTSSVATLLGFTNPATPVAMINNQLIDTVSGRTAYYGRNGQPGSASPVPGGTSWIDPSGKTVYYSPTNYAYGDPNRAPVIPPTNQSGAMA